MQTIVRIHSEVLMNASDNLFHNCELPSNRSTEPLAPRIEPATGLPLGGLAVNARSPADGVGIAVFLSQRLRPSRLAHATRSPGLWLWDGYLRAANITLFPSQ